VKFLDYAIVGSGLCSFIASLKVKKSSVLTKLNYDTSDVTKILNFYEYNNPGGNTNIWGAYINLERFKKFLILNKKFRNFYEQNNIFTTSRISKNSHFKKIGYIQNKKTKKILRLDKSFFKNSINFDLKKITINKNYVDLISNKKTFRAKKVNLCIGNIGLIKVLKQSNLIFSHDIITYEDSSIKYVLNFNLNNKKFYYIPMSIKQIIEKLIYKSNFYNINENKNNLIVQGVSKEKKIFKFSIEKLLNAKKSFHRGLTTNHISNLRINNVPIEKFLRKKSKRVIINNSGTISKYIPGSISQDLIFNTFVKS
tara:strand:+ start:9802 stop:10734 length:933 start_codon:yes stop_codon:yes gene_type:complete